MTAITIDETGRLEIPLEIRQQLGFTAQQSLGIEVSNAWIVVTALIRTLLRASTTLSPQ